MSQLTVKECILNSAPKSCELDPITSKLLIECLYSILPSLTDLFNSSLASGIFPQCFKSALVTPILKKKCLDHNDLNNYRPVSNLCFIAKIMEKLVLSQVSSYLNSHNLYNTCQSAQIPFKKSVKNLRFTLDCHLTMNAHVSNIARTFYFELRRLSSIRRFLTSTATATIVSPFDLSRIDYCNSLLFGSTHDVTSHLQRIQNYAARVILRLPKSSSITIHLNSLHWLPVKVRSTYKIACWCYHCHSSTAPSYVTIMLHRKPLHTRNTRSNSYTMPLLNRPAHILGNT